MSDPTIYELLAAQQASSTTVDQLHRATKDTFIDAENIEFWSGMITVARMLQESRTYSHGLSIPEQGYVWKEAVADSASVMMQPTNATEIWRVEGIDLDSCTVAFTDGNEFVTLDPDKNIPPYLMTKTLYLAFSNASGSEKNPKVAYSKVSL